MLFPYRLCLFLLLGIFHSTYLCTMETSLKSRPLKITFEGGKLLTNTSEHSITQIKIGETTISCDKTKEIGIPVLTGILTLRPNLQSKCTHHPKQTLLIPEKVTHIWIKDLTIQAYTAEYARIDQIVVESKPNEPMVHLGK